MSWGTELWDQYARLEKHTQSGIDAVDKYTHFVKERHRIEQEYAANLKKLIRTYTPKKKDEETDFTTKKSFGTVLQEMTGIANQHEIVADNLASNVVKELQVYISELKDERKKHFKDAKQEEQALNTSVNRLEKTKDAYRGAYNDYIRAKNQFQKVDDDVNQTKAQVEKCRRTMDSKNKSREDCKNEYILQLQQTNEDQRSYYSTKLPAVFQRIQSMDEQRIGKLGDYFKKFAESHSQVLPLIGKCLDGISEAGNAVSPTGDSGKVVERHKTGLNPPDDYEMMDLEEQNSGGSLPGHNTPQADSTSIGSSDSSINKANGGTISGRSNKKTRKGLGFFKAKEEVKPKEDFSHLPPNQQRRKLQEKIDEIQGQIDQEMKSKDALTKMRDVYTKNPALGDPNTTDKELAIIGKKLDAMRLELQKYQGYMDNAEGKPAGSNTPTGTPQHTPHTTPVPGRANHAPLASSNPQLDLIDAGPGASTPGAPEESNGTSTGSEGAQMQDSPSRITRDDSFIDDEEFDDGDDDDEHPVLFQSKAVYTFETEDPNLLGLTEGELIDVLEEDDGDGWTRVRRGNEEGYVPTSYLVKA